MTAATSDSLIGVELPSFSRPPVNEVALGMQFAAPDLQASHVGELYARLRDRFPQRQEVPPLLPAFETFQPFPPMAKPFLPGLPLSFARQWFTSDDGELLVQFQPDRLILNWRQRPGGGPYIRYERLRSVFVTLEADFRRFMAEDVGGNAVPNQCDVTYFNRVELDDPADWGRPGRWLNVWNDEDGGSDAVQFATRHLLKDSSGSLRGRLTVSAEGAFSESGRPELSFNISVKGPPSSADTEGVLSFFDLARAAIVQRFDAIITPEAAALWGRRT